MKTTVDVGFFEPFRNNMKSVSGDGRIEAFIRYKINFDPLLISQYFEDVNISYSRGREMTFTARCKSEEVLSILNSFMYSFTFTMSGGMPDA